MGNSERIKKWEVSDQKTELLRVVCLHLKAIDFI